MLEGQRPESQKIVGQKQGREGDRTVGAGPGSEGEIDGSVWNWDLKMA